MTWRAIFTWHCSKRALRSKGTAVGLGRSLDRGADEKARQVSNQRLKLN
jgi:hypothetical protein